MYWQGDVRVSARPRAARIAGERHPAFLFVAFNPIYTRCIMSNRPLSLWYPVWNQLHQSDPFMASIRNIVRASHEPTVETALIGSVFYMAQTENGIEYAEAIARRMAGKGVAA